MNEREFEDEFGAILRDLDNDSTSGCPTVETLVAMQEGILSGPDLELTRSHLKDCDLCRSMVVRMGESAVDELDDLAWKRVEKRLDSRVRPWRSNRLGLSSVPYVRVAAAAVLLVAVSLVFWSNRQAQQRRPSVTRGETIQLLRPEGTVSRVRALEWSSPPVASLFRVTVEGEWGEESYQSRDTHFTIPESLRARLSAGKKYRWRVEALDEGGNVVLRSDWTGFRIEER